MRCRRTGVPGKVLVLRDREEQGRNQVLEQVIRTGCYEGRGRAALFQWGPWRALGHKT